MSETRKCPYCGKKLTERPYWRHVEKSHPKEYANDQMTWVQLFQDYTSMGMNQFTTITVISEIFNKDFDVVKSFLKKQGQSVD
ncbi:MAG: hypothetical protein ACTSRK_18845 [Promethearchaeota archaeon]